MGTISIRDGQKPYGLNVDLDTCRKRSSDLITSTISLERVCVGGGKGSKVKFEFLHYAHKGP